MTSWTKERTLQFIEYYRAHECLWKVKSKNYSNKIMRERAYDELTNFVKSFYPMANKDTVVCKLTNLRGSWRKEHKKMMASQVSGSGFEEQYEYQPSLFYFDHLLFLSDSNVPGKDQEIGYSTDDAFETKVLDTQMSDKNVESQEQPFYSQDHDMIDYDEQHYEESTPSSPVSSTNIAPRPPSTTPMAEGVGMRKRGPTPKRKKVALENLLMQACEKLQVPATTSETLSKDKHDSFGQTIAHDLRSMSWDQVIHAKKLISDVLYEGQLHNLSRSSRVIAGSTGSSTYPDNDRSHPQN